MHATVNQVGNPKNFQTGKSLEIYVAGILTEKIEQSEKPGCVIHNMQVVLPDGAEAELDVLAAHGRKLLWVEAKTGELTPFLSRYDKIRKYLGLPPERALVVVAGCPGNIEAIGAVHSVKLVESHEFRKSMIGIIP